MAEERRAGIGDGIRTGIGILTAFKEAMEETLEEAIERGDLSPERAKMAVREAAHQVQSSLDEARVRLDFIPRKELDGLRQELIELRTRVDRLERTSASPSETGSGTSPDTTEGPDAPGPGAASIPVD